MKNTATSNILKVNELLGTAGTGKTTIKNILSDNYPNLIFTLDNMQPNFFLIKKLPLYLYIYIKTKNLKKLKSLISIHIFFHNVNNDVNMKKNKYIFDHGPIFIISMLILEMPSLKKLFLKELDGILKYYDELIYLKAPVEILCQRINTREENHRIKNKDNELQKIFLNNYTNIFNSIINICKTSNVNITIIDTNKHAIEEVGELVLAQFKNK